MLKIKDNVDLKELEKYGFDFNEDEETDCFGDKIYELNNSYFTYLGGGGRRGQEYYLFVNEARELRVYSSKPEGSGTDTNIFFVLFDLIEDGLVEKV